ncbi:MAG TPA: twin-arginine translocation signal domain-containing protein, partial [Casimicrobiaceae bacterium]|nr:twin-arginine translocation signal domain-containing protein [Casimicrobiaceae bacterium]
MTISRRNFIAHAGALGAAGLVGNLSQWGIRAASAQSLGDYKALVCVFLFGGNDSNNTVIPYDDYGSYSAVRTTASNINIPKELLLQISPPRAGAKFGLHPNLGPLQTLFNAGKLAVIVNAGPLLAPLTKAQYQAGVDRPLNLFSHSDQQNEWQGLIDGMAIRTGWGGRVG